MRDTILNAANVLQEQWLAVQSLSAALAQREEEIQAALKRVAGEDGGYLFSGRHDYSLYDLQESLFGMLESVIRKTLANRNLAVSVDLRELRTWDRVKHSRTGISEAEMASRINFVEVGERAAAKYAEDTVAGLAMAEASAYLEEYFAPRWGRPPEITERGGKRVLETRIWQDPYYNKQRWELSHHCTRKLFDVLRKLRTLVQGEEIEGLSQYQMAVAVKAIEERTYWSRMKLNLGEGCEMIFFKEKIDWVFAPATLQGMMVAIRTHQPARAPT